MRDGSKPWVHPARAAMEKREGKVMNERIEDALKAGARAIADGFRSAVDFAMESTILALKIVVGLWVLRAVLDLLLFVTA